MSSAEVEDLMPAIFEADCTHLDILKMPYVILVAERLLQETEPKGSDIGGKQGDNRANHSHHAQIRR